MKGCTINDHVNNLLDSTEQNIDPWKNDGIVSGQWSGNAGVHEKCGKGEAWYGWASGSDVGSMRNVNF